MEYADWNDVNEFATKQVGKFSVFVSNGLGFNTKEESDIWDFVVIEVIKIYGNKTPEYYDAITNLISGGLFFFDSESEARVFYHIFEQELTDSSPIYAAFYCPVNGCLTENT